MLGVPGNAVLAAVGPQNLLVAMVMVKVLRYLWREVSSNTVPNVICAGPLKSGGPSCGL